MSKNPMKKSSEATWLTRFFGGHTNHTDRTFEHELFWTRITRMPRIFFFGTRISLTDLCSRRGAHMGDTRFLNTDVTLYFLNTNNSDNTNIFLAHGSHSIYFWTRDSPWVHWPKASNYADNTNFFLHTDLTDLTDLCSRRGLTGFWTRDSP